MACKKGRSRFFYLRLRSLLLSAVMNVELASAVQGWVCGLRYDHSCGGGCIDELKKIKK